MATSMLDVMSIALMDLNEHKAPVLDIALQMAESEREGSSHRADHLGLKQNNNLENEMDIIDTVSHEVSETASELQSLNCYDENAGVYKGSSDDFQVSGVSCAPFTYSQPNTTDLNRESSRSENFSVSGQETMFVPRQGLVSSDGGLSAGPYLNYMASGTTYSSTSYNDTDPALPYFTPVFQDPHMYEYQQCYENGYYQINYSNPPPEQVPCMQQYPPMPYYYPDQNSQMQNYDYQNAYQNYQSQQMNPYNVMNGNHAYTQQQLSTIPSTVFTGNERYQQVHNIVPETNDKGKPSTASNEECSKSALKTSVEIPVTKNSLLDKEKPKKNFNTKAKSNPDSAKSKNTVIDKNVVPTATSGPMESVNDYQLAPPSFYQNVPPPNMKVPPPVCVSVICSAPSAAAVTTPSGDRLYIPLDDNLYEIKGDEHNLYGMPADCGLRAFEKESEFGVSARYDYSPRPIQEKGSISDEEDSGSAFLSQSSSCVSSLSSAAAGESLTSLANDGVYNSEPEVKSKDATFTEMEESAATIESKKVRNEFNSADDTKLDSSSTPRTNIKVIESSVAMEDTQTDMSEYDVSVESIAKHQLDSETSATITEDVLQTETETPLNEQDNVTMETSVPYVQCQNQFLSYVPGETANDVYTMSYPYNPEVTFVPQQTGSPIGEFYNFNETAWNQPMYPTPENDFVLTCGDTQQMSTSETAEVESQSAYPALHVSEDGLVTVMLRHGVFLEMTTDKALRLVCHDRKLVVALNSTGNSACLIHPAAKIFQNGTTVDVNLYLARKVKIMTENTVFGNNFNTYVFDYTMIEKMEGFANFLEQTEDRSVGFLSTDSGFFNLDIAMRTSEIVSRAYFEKYQTIGCKVIVNGVKIIQNDNGDVSVYSGPIKFLRLSPLQPVLRLKSQFLEVDIETNWNVKVRRGMHTLNASYLGLILSNGKIKACIDQNNKLQAFALPDHQRLYLGQRLHERRPGVPRQRYINLSQRKSEPEGDHWNYSRQHGY